VVAVVVGGLYTLGAYAERHASTPTDEACRTMLDYHRSAPGGEDKSDALDRLRYVAGRLDKATGPEAVAIREYLADDSLYRGAALGPSVVILEPDEAELVGRLSPRLMRAAQACTDVGHPELREYLHDAGDEGDVPR
jgi:hypothetical protein